MAVTQRKRLRRARPIIQLDDRRRYVVCLPPIPEHEQVRAALCGQLYDVRKHNVFVNTYELQPRSGGPARMLLHEQIVPYGQAAWPLTENDVVVLIPYRGGL